MLVLVLVITTNHVYFVQTINLTSNTTRQMYSQQLIKFHCEHNSIERIHICANLTKLIIPVDLLNFLLKK